MKVAKDLVVSLAYQVRTEDGVLVDESPVSAPLDYLCLLYTSDAADE